MSVNLFQRIFDRKSDDSVPRARRLAMESLENREMLNVDWSGFGAETVSEYEASSEAAYSVDFAGSVDMIKLGDLTGDGRNELVAVNSKTKTVDVYANTASSGDFVLKSSQTLSELSGQSNCDSFFISGNKLTFISVTSDNSGLVSSTYSWNSTTSSLVLDSQTTLDASSFKTSTSGVFLFVGVKAALISTSNGNAVTVQATTLTQSGQSVKTSLFSGFGKSAYGTSGTSLGTISETLMGSAKIKGNDYLLLREATSSTNNLVLASVGTTVTKYSYDLSSYGSYLTFDWVESYNGTLLVGAQTGGSSGIITIKATTPVDDTDASTLGQWIACDDMRFNSTSCAAVGDIGGDSDPEILTVNGSSYLFWLGDASSTYDYTFTKDSLVVSSPEYVSVYIGDVDGDGVKDALLVGEKNIYRATVSDSGAIGAPETLYSFSQTVKKAVFGDFNGDGLIDIAVQYQASVGSSLQVFQQISDGSYIARATQTYNSALIDVAVGKYSQTAVDEIAVLYNRTGSTTAASVQTLQLTNSSSLVATRSFTAASLAGSSLATGSIYGSSVDDLIVVSSSQDTITVLRNTGSSFSGSTITTSYDGTSSLHPSSAVIGDFNGDGLADVAVLNSSSGSNYAHVAYYLRSEDSGLGVKPTNRVALNGTIAVSGLVAADLNNDGYDDLAYSRLTTSGTTVIGALMGNGASSVFDSEVSRSTELDPSDSHALALFQVDADNISYDLVWAQDKSVGVLLNGDSTEASGQVAYLVQSGSASASATYAAAQESQRTWIDEWSNYAVEVWVNANGATVTTATANLGYNDDYFTVSSIEAGTGYTLTTSTDNGLVTISATGSGALDSNGWTLVARIRFAPAGGEGVPLPEDGKLQAVASGMTATASAQSLNGAVVQTVTAPSVALYPFIFDIDENGLLNMNDLAVFVPLLGQNVSSLSNQKYGIFDYDQNGVLNMNDLANLVPSLGLSATSGLDSIYASEPATSSASSVVLDAVFSDVLFDAAQNSAEEEAAIADVAEAFVGPRYYAPAATAAAENAAPAKSLQTGKSDEKIDFSDDLDVDLSVLL